MNMIRIKKIVNGFLIGGENMMDTYFETIEEIQKAIKEYFKQ